MITPTETWCYVHFDDKSVLAWPSNLFCASVHEQTVNDMIEISDRIVVREEIINPSNQGASDD